MPEEIVARILRLPGSGLDGEKWFYSNASADLSVVSARPEGAPDGTVGIGLFPVSHRLDSEGSRVPIAP